MSLYLDNKVDPIAAAGGRELNFIPKHFQCVSLGKTYYSTSILRNWIWKNQSGRFCIGIRDKFVDDQLKTTNVVAFEDSSEAVMFSFILPTLENNYDDIF